MPEPFDKPAAAADIIGSGGDGRPPSMRRLPWPWLRKVLAGRRPRIAVAAAMAVAAAIAIAAVLTPHSPSAAKPSHTPAKPSHPHTTAPLQFTNHIDDRPGPGGVFASGAVSGRPWQLAVQDIADPGARCIPGVTVNGTDAVPISPASTRPTPIGNLAFLTLGSAVPGIGFAFVQLPSGTDWLWLSPDSFGGAGLGKPPVTVTACGDRFALTGFAYPLARTLTINEDSPSGPERSYRVPDSQSDPQPTLADPQVTGIWQDTSQGTVTTAALASGQANGGRWAITVTLGTRGDCFTLSGSYLSDTSTASTPPVAAVCAPIGTPTAPGTLTTLPLAPPVTDSGGTGYAGFVSPGTKFLLAQLSDGNAIQARPVTVAGRRYVAFFVPSPLRLIQLNSTGRP